MRENESESEKERARAREREREVGGLCKAAMCPTAAAALATPSSHTMY